MTCMDVHSIDFIKKPNCPRNRSVLVLSKFAPRFIPHPSPLSLCPVCRQGDPQDVLPKFLYRPLLCSSQWEVLIRDAKRREKGGHFSLCLGNHFWQQLYILFDSSYQLEKTMLRVTQAHWAPITSPLSSVPPAVANAWQFLFSWIKPLQMFF